MSWLSEKIINGNSKKNKLKLKDRLTFPSVDIKKISFNSKLKRVSFNPNKRRYLFGAMSLVSGMTLFGGIIWATPLGRVQAIKIDGNRILSKQEILNRLSLDLGESIFRLNLEKSEMELEKDSLIDSATIKRKGFDSLSIEIDEQPLIGCLEINQYYYYVLESGDSVTNQQATTCQGLTFKGVQTEEGLESLRLFVQTLDEVDHSVRNLIKEVAYEPIYGDVNRFSLFLSDGNTVKVNTYTMAKKLAYYPMLLSQVHQFYGEVKGEFHLDVGDSFNPYRDENANSQTEEMTEETENEEAQLGESQEVSSEESTVEEMVEEESPVEGEEREEEQVDEGTVE